MKIIAITGVAACLLLQGCGNRNSNISHQASKEQIETGRYLVVVSGCNDCHTNGYLMTEGKVPEQDWLAGSPVGWQGPWGTTYPTNLRLRVHEWTEEEWVATLKNRKALPPMPWMNINQMKEEDAKAIYAYIKSLGPKGEHMPQSLGPNVIPSTPYISLLPNNLPQTEK